MIGYGRVVIARRMGLGNNIEPRIAPAHTK
jgi:hypothetical protein